MVEQWSEESRAMRFAKLLGNSGLIPEIRSKTTWSQPSIVLKSAAGRSRFLAASTEHLIQILSAIKSSRFQPELSWVRGQCPWRRNLAAGVAPRRCHIETRCVDSVALRRLAACGLAIVALVHIGRRPVTNRGLQVDALKWLRLHTTGWRATRSEQSN